MILIFFISHLLSAQSTSNLIKDKKFQKLSFKLINNLIVVPLDLNNEQGNFILDTGVKGNLLFMAGEKDFHLNDSLEQILIRGFGYGEPLKAYVSKGNEVRYKNILFNNRKFYLLDEDSFNFSAKTGIVIHGLIGADFFRNNVVKIDYKNKKVIVYDSTYFYRKKRNRIKADSVPLTFHGDKPYLTGDIKILENDTLLTPVKLLIDTGSTDALWLFKDESKFKNLPSKYFTDFIGESLTGSLHGDKSRIEYFSFGGHNFRNPIVSFIDEEISHRARRIAGRNGTIGGGVLKRFTLWFDYQNQYVLLKKNSNYSNEFYYNMSGLEVNYDGSVVVLEVRQNSGNGNSSNGSNVVLSYQYVLKPTYKIVNVRKGSPGGLSGLKKGDVLLEINGISVQEKTYGDIVEDFYTKKNKKVRLLIRRKNKEMHFEFTLIDELD